MGLVDDALAGKEMVAGDEPIVIDVWKASDTGSANDPQPRPGHAYETRLAFQVWDGNGGLRLRSDAGPVQALAEQVPGFSNHMINGELWRVFTLRSARGYWYQAGELDAIRDELAGDIARGRSGETRLKSRH